jgi:hypothetical protein
MRILIITKMVPMYKLVDMLLKMFVDNYEP